MLGPHRCVGCTTNWAIEALAAKQVTPWMLPWMRYMDALGNGWLDANRWHGWFTDAFRSFIVDVYIVAAWMLWQRMGSGMGSSFGFGRLPQHPRQTLTLCQVKLHLQPFDDVPRTDALHGMFREPETRRGRLWRADNDKSSDRSNCHSNGQ